MFYGFRPGPIQSQMTRDWKFRIYEEKNDGTIYDVAKTNTLICCAITAQLFCAFVFACLKIKFSYHAAKISSLTGLLRADSVLIFSSAETLCL